MGLRDRCLPRLEQEGDFEGNSAPCQVAEGSPDGARHLVADSTLKLLPVRASPGEKLKGKAVAFTRHVKNTNWGVYVTEGIISGATVQEITHKSIGHDGPGNHRCP